MKVVSPKQMSDLESDAYHDGFSATDFMEEAGSGIALVANDFIEQYELGRHVVLLCGKGNNAGDAYVAGVHLLQLDYEVTAYQLFPIEECSQLCKDNHFYFINAGGKVNENRNPEELSFPDSGIIIDGIFGTGFRGRIKEPIAGFIRRTNESHLPIISIDIPSGLHGETGEVASEAIEATITAFLGLPKLGFFLSEGWNYVGKLWHVDFGLPKRYIDEAKADLIMLSQDGIVDLFPHMVRNRHKYQAGQVIGLAGSQQMPGAAILASNAALHGGAGIVRLLFPEEMRAELASAPYELIKIPYKKTDNKSVIELMNRAAATFVGPGLGLAPEVKALVREVLSQLKAPTVIDADALTILSEEKIPLPDHTILTPHHGEMERLLNGEKVTLDLKFFKRLQKYAQENNVTLVLKGAPTFIFQKGEPICVSAHGDPGMATAGSGDVLTGLIAAFLAQGALPHQAACLGVYLHGLAGEFAAEEYSSYCMVASDIIDFFPEAFFFGNGP